VQCIVLKGFAGLLNKPTQEHTTFAKEFSDRVRVVACLTHLPNIAHSDSASETLFGRDWQKIHKKLKTEDRDALILCWGNAADTQMAVSEIALRAKEATLGVPSSTQQGLKDGTTGFERVLPGAERMYPDTDLPPIVLSPKKLQQIQKNLPEYVWDREDRFRQMGIPKDTIEVLSISPRIELFSRLLTELKINPTFAAVVLCQTLKSFRRKRLKPERLRDETIFHVFQAYAKGKLAREGVVTVLELILVQNVEKLETYADLLNFLEVLKMAPLSESELTQSVLKAVENINPALFRNPQKIHSYLMGKLMRNLIGRVDGKKLSERVQEQLQVHDSKPLALKAQA
jgi:glutamyl-tRNA(Gln) amidotransferase subunit E